MAIVDLRPDILDIEMTQGDDLTIVCTFSISLTGYTTWTAKARYNGVTSSFTVDTSLQGSKIITLTLAGAVTAIFTNADWSLKATDPNGKIQTLMRGVIRAEPEPA